MTRQGFCHEAESDIFFRFLALKPRTANADIKYCLHDIGVQDATDGSHNAHEVWPFLVKIQRQCVADFFEKLRLGSGPSLAAKMIPSALKVDTMDQDQWLLAECKRGMACLESPVTMKARRFESGCHQTSRRASTTMRRSRTPTWDSVSRS